MTLSVIENVFHGLRGEELIDRIYWLENQLLQTTEVDTLKENDLKTVHYFEDGLYARELHIPKDTMIIGKMHKKGQIITVSKGDISILTDNGMVRVQAPFTFASGEGAKRVGYAHEDTVVTTYSATNLKDVAEIEKEIIISTHAQYLEYKQSTAGEAQCLG